ncbi:MAG: FkbM family methyltransferase, partial [Ktedonobacteraceae bacterium]
PGMCFFDVGAHVGQYALLAAPIVGITGQVHAFEPDPETFVVLNQNAEVNHLDNVYCVNAALAANEGQVTFYLSGPACMGTNSLRENNYSSGKQLNVLCTTLSAYALKRNIHQVHAMKIDAEGAEYDILASSSAFLQNNPPLLLLEFNAEALGRFGHTNDDLARLLSSMTYSLFRIEVGGVKRYHKALSDATFFNILAVPEAKLDLIEEIKLDADST